MALSHDSPCPDNADSQFLIILLRHSSNAIVDLARARGIARVDLTVARESRSRFA